MQQPSVTNHNFDSEHSRAAVGVCVRMGWYVINFKQF